MPVDVPAVPGPNPTSKSKLHLCAGLQSARAFVVPGQCHGPIGWSIWSLIIRVLSNSRLAFRYLAIRNSGWLPDLPDRHFLFARCQFDAFGCKLYPSPPMSTAPLTCAPK